MRSQFYIQEVKGRQEDWKLSLVEKEVKFCNEKDGKFEES